MKLYYSLITLVILSCCYSANSQKKTFNGEIKMAIKVTSKCPEISDEEWMRYLFLNDSGIHTYLNLKHKEVFNEYTHYNLYNLNKFYATYKDIDSLYEINFINNMFNEKMDTTFVAIDSLIHGYKCNKFTLRSKELKSEFFFLDSNKYDNGNCVFIGYYKDNPFYTISSEAISIEEKFIDSQIFVIPDLPLSPLKTEKVNLISLKIPEFDEGEKGWAKYISRNTKSELGCDYIKIPKGQKLAMQSVNVFFALDSNGNVVKSVPINIENIHPKLVKEALRVIDRSPSWKNATYHNKAIPFIFSQKIIFACAEE